MGNYKLLDITYIANIVLHLEDINLGKSFIDPIICKCDITNAINIRNNIFNYEALYFASLDNEKIKSLCSFQIIKSPYTMKILILKILTNYDEDTPLFLNFCLEKIRLFLDEYNKIIIYLKNDNKIKSSEKELLNLGFNHEITLKNELDGGCDLLIYSRIIN